MARLVVSDANILIDMEHGGLLEAFFCLPFEVVVPDTLYAEEIEPHFVDLAALGLRSLQLEGETIAYIDELISRTPNAPGSNDMLALGLARQEGATLMTGDQTLRDVAESEGLEVHGTVWVVDLLIRTEILTLTIATAAYQRMLDADRRLPIPDMEAMLRNHGWEP